MRRARLLHVLASAPAAVLLTAAFAPSAPAVSAASIPPPVVVCLDPGHGGNDPGASGLDGLVEKDITLDVATRLASLLRADGVTVVMTRASDQSVSIQQRSDAANSSRADVYISIHFNAYTDPSAEGSLVLYPYQRDAPFAQAMSQGLAAYLGPQGVGNGGLVLRNDWWLQPTMPTVTLESLYITNAHDASLLVEPSFRQGLASAMKDGIESYLPGIMQRKQELLPAGGAPAPTHAAVSQPARTHVGSGPAPAGGGGLRPSTHLAGTTGTPAAVTVLRWLLLIAAVALSVRHRRRLRAAAGSLSGFAVERFRSSAVHRRSLRRRRRLVRERALATQQAEALRPWTAHSAGASPPEEPMPLGLELRGRPVQQLRHPVGERLPRR